MTIKTTPSLPFYLFAIGVFFIIVSPNLLSEGLFMDGLIYATVANNLAHGIGSFWNPHFSSTYLADFHEHPPLVFGIQSLFYMLFGDSRLIEKCYSLLTVITVGSCILRIWKILRLKQGWLPLLFWLLIPLVSWACCNNMLENTMTIFTTFSVLFYLRGQQGNHSLFTFLSGFMLALAFLCKGFVAFFPWTFPFLYWCFLRGTAFRRMALDAIIVFLSTMVPLFLLTALFPDARISLLKYLDIQVITSLKNSTTVDSRLFIVIRLFKELIPASILCGLFMLCAWRFKINFSTLKNDYKKALLFIFLGLTGVLPIMVSMKQSGYYILATFPFFALGISILIYPTATALLARINYQSKGYLFFKWFGTALFFVGLALVFINITHFGRDKNKLKDIYQIATKLPRGCILAIEMESSQDWSLRGYFERYKNIGLDPYNENKRAYLLIHNNTPSDTIRSGYQIVPLLTTEYKLFKRIDNRRGSGGQ